MGQFRSGLRFLATASLMLTAATAHASISRVSNPVDIVYEPKVFVKFDAAFDSVNRVYLAVWGTQYAGPTNGIFLNEAGAPITGVFAISDHSDGSLQAGWARVIYSAQEGKFLVSYTKILAPNVHGKAARFVAYSGGGPAMSAEIRIASGYGHPGTESGIAYSTVTRTFLVTWWTYYGPTVKPITFVTAINPAGAILSPAIPGLNGWGTPITNPNDGQADPEIACDPTTRHCLVIGFSWGTFYGGNSPPPAVWGRYIDDVTGAPLGADSFYLPIFGYIDSPTVSFGGGRFLVAYTGNGQVLGNVATGAGLDVTTFTPAYGLRVSSPATNAQDGGGYRYPSLSYNSATNTTLLAASGYQGYPTAQEIGGDGAPIAGALDFLPDPGPNYDARTQYTIPVANNVTPGFLYLDNHQFLTIRSSRYSTTAGAPPPPPPPSCASSLSTTSVNVISPGQTFPVGVTLPASCAWTATSTVPWVQISQNASAPGPGTVVITVQRNVARGARSGSVTIAGQTLTVQQAAFNTSATSDLDGDGFSDLLWQYQPNGALAMWNVRGNTFMLGQMIANSSDVSWKVVGTGDLNGDGHADILWQKDEGPVVAWLWTPTAYAWAFLNPWDVGPYWKVKCVGDFNGDGRADIVFQHTTEGWLAVWFMGPDGLTASSISLLSIPKQTDPNWVIVGAGDINGDNVADIIWQSQSNGMLAAWLMSGATVFNWNLLSTYTPDLNWKVMGVGDVEGNGMADLIWHNVATGQVAVWSMNGFTVINMYLIYNGAAPAVADPAWRLVGPG